MKKLHVKVILGSTRQGRYGDKPASWIFGELGKLESITAELLDLRDYPLPFYDEPVSPMRLNGNYSTPQIKKWSEKIKEADAFIIIAPEYNHGYTAVLKNALDHLYPEWNFKPVGFISYGSVGGARVIEQLRQVAVELQMLPIKNAIHAPIDLYMQTMTLAPDAAPELFNKFLRDGARNHLELFIGELLHVAENTRGLRSADRA